MKHWLSQIELGKWFSNAQYYYRPRNDRERKLIHDCYEEGYNNGYEAGKPKWHDLRKNPDDLPPRLKRLSETVINQIGTPCHYNFEKSCWQNWSYIDIETPIAWCELPKFEE